MKYKYLSSLFVLTLLSISSCAKVPGDVKFTVNDPSKVEIHTELQKGLIEATDLDVWLNQHKYDLTTFSNSAPQGVKVSYEIKTDNGAKGSYSVITSETEDFADSYAHSAGESSATLYNLKLGTKYYYKVKAVYKTTVFESEVKSFVTNNIGPRNIYAEGVENVRDLGGYTLEDGRKIKQGLIYRTAQFNYDHGDESAIKSEPTGKGKDVLVHQLGIKSDIDVREKQTSSGKDETIGCNSSPLGSGVKYVSLPMRFKNSNVLTNSVNTESVKAFFEYCAVEENYPIAFHCVRGTDRTGALAYALGAICGMSEKDLMLDYTFSNFANIGGSVMTSRNISGTAFYVYGINSATGDTMKEKAKNYLMSEVGIPGTTIDKIVQILVG